MSVHTPNPYRPSFPHDTELYVAETDDPRDMEVIAQVGPAERGDEALANACLFEVAGEMLEAARAVLKNYGYFRPNVEWALPDHHPLTALRAVIAKYEDGIKRGQEEDAQWRAKHQAKAEPTAREVMDFREKAAGLTE